MTWCLTRVVVETEPQAQAVALGRPDPLVHLHLGTRGLEGAQAQHKNKCPQQTQLFSPEE